MTKRKQHSTGQSQTSVSAEAQLAAITDKFAEYQARLTEAIVAGRTGWYRIAVHVESGLVDEVDQATDDRWRPHFGVPSAE